MVFRSTPCERKSPFRGLSHFWLVVWNVFIFPYIYWECHHPNWHNWLSYFFQRGRYTTNQIYIQYDETVILMKMVLVYLLYPMVISNIYIYISCINGWTNPTSFFFLVGWSPRDISRYSRTMLQKSQVMGCNMEWAQWPGMICRLDMSMYLYIYIYRSIYLSIYLSTILYLFICLIVYLLCFIYTHTCTYVISHMCIYIHTNTQLVLQCYNGKLMEYIMINNVIFACICKWGEPVSPQMAMITVDLGYK